MLSTARPIREVLLAALVLAVVAPGARAQDYGVGPNTYYLQPPSSYQQGCWGDCACPLSNHEPMRGTFTLSLITVGDATDFYSVTAVNWRVPRLAGAPLDLSLTGSGQFLAGQHPFATHQHMSLGLTLASPQGSSSYQFYTTAEADMRTVAPPVIDIELSNSTTGCPGIRLRVVASRFRADWNADGVVNVPDIYGFLSAWFAGSIAADFDGSGGLSVGDIFAFLADWFGHRP